MKIHTRCYFLFIPSFLAADTGHLQINLFSCFTAAYASTHVHLHACIQKGVCVHSNNCNCMCRQVPRVLLCKETRIFNCSSTKMWQQRMIGADRMSPALAVMPDTQSGLVFPSLVQTTKIFVQTSERSCVHTHISVFRFKVI